MLTLFFLSVLGLHCCLGFSLTAMSGATLVVIQGLLSAVTSVVAEGGLQGLQASGVAVPRLWSTA